MHPVLQSALRNLTVQTTQFDATSAGVHPCGRLHCWSVQQIIQHLILSMDDTRALLERRLAKGRPERSARRSRTEWLMQLMVLSAGHMPTGVGAPPETIPPDELTPSGIHELIDGLEAAAARLDRTLDLSRQRFGMERVGRHFLLGPLRVDQWRRYHVLHIEHHTRQIAELRETLLVELHHNPRMARV
jgi:Protein of unknown function (DUF1569)